MDTIIKNYFKFEKAAPDAYLETKVVVAYISFLTTWFQKAILRNEIPSIRDVQNQKLFKKADVLKWLLENNHVIDPDFLNSKTSVWLEQCTNDKFSSSTAEATKNLSNSKKGDLS